MSSRAARAVVGLADARRPLDESEVGHGIGQCAGKKVQPPVQLFLAQARHAAGNGLAEFAQDMPVVVGQELAQVVVLFGIRACDHAYERAAVLAVLRHRQRRLDEGSEHGRQLAGLRLLRRFQLLQARCGHFVHAPAEHLVDQVFLGAEVIVDRGDIDVGLRGQLAQRRACKPVLGEQLLGRTENAVLGGEVGGLGHARRQDSIKRLFESTGSPAGRSCRNAARFRRRCANAALTR